MAAAGPLDELQQARAALLRGQIAFASASSDAPALLAKAAKQLQPLDAALARQTCLDAWVAAILAGRFAVAGPKSPGPVSPAARRRAPAIRSASGRTGRPGHRGTRRAGTPAEAGNAVFAGDEITTESAYGGPPATVGAVGTTSAGTRLRTASSSPAARRACWPSR
jgi:hypothetical protein